jgi:hypothetical protein
MSYQFKIKYSSERPPNWDMIFKAFGSALDWDSGVIITYGDTYYAKRPGADHIVAHEEVHMNQQANTDGGPDAWWNRYFEDTAFRLHQELEAYKIQLRFYRETLMDVARPERKFKLRKAEEWMAGILSSPMYGNMIGYNKALEL